MLKRAGVPTRDIPRIYLMMIRSVLKYACQVWHTSLSGAHSDKLESVQRRALHIVYPDLSYAKALSQSGLSLLSNRREDLCRDLFKDMLSPSHRRHHLLPQNTPPPATEYTTSCHRLHHLLPQNAPPPDTEYTTSCHRLHHLLPQITPPPATEYTTSCLCRVFHPTTFAIGPYSRGFVHVAIASGRHLYLMYYSIGNDFTIIVSS